VTGGGLYLKILIAEDDDVSRLLLERLLEKMGHELISTTNGLEGLKAFQDNEIDMAILDWMMPEMDGIELCMKIRELEEGTETPTFIFMITARSDAKDMLHALTIGVDDFLTKPVDKKMLEHRIKRGLKYQNFLKLDSKSKQEPYIVLTEEHDVLRSLIHIFDVIYDKLETGVSEQALDWSVSTLATLTLRLHQNKEEQYFHSFINAVTSEHVDWFGNLSESSFVTLTEEHDDLESSMMNLQGQISRYSLEGNLAISSLKSSIKSYTGILLRHMSREEKLFFPFAQKYLTGDDLMDLRVKFEQIDKIIGKKKIDDSINEISMLLNLIIDSEENIRTWRPIE
jgi:DNA-binding response OmpR family regulator